MNMRSAWISSIARTSGTGGAEISPPAPEVGCNLHRLCCVVSCADPVGNVSWMLFPEGRSSELRLRRGFGQAVHTLNNPQVECAGVLLCVIRE